MREASALLALSKRSLAAYSEAPRPMAPYWRSRSRLNWRLARRGSRWPWLALLRSCGSMKVRLAAMSQPASTVATVVSMPRMRATSTFSGRIGLLPAQTIR
ncbi:hypothetical protein D3C77_641580 [compost metagenome]